MYTTVDELSPGTHFKGFILDRFPSFSFYMILFLCVFLFFFLENKWGSSCQWAVDDWLKAVNVGARLNTQFNPSYSRFLCRHISRHVAYSS